ncbi:glutamine synthetase family protein [Mameliella sediminis]|uniref:glutamine synthetase family protein n=1 Tax=Mameliella sediminis TaxID=2836866 RepID=UPI001C45BEED|nr:glutamine synthetase family protein [Mameliella sediminis]MBV7397091.1 glutamine synthetase family protein [Mameliella sediminis]MBY6161960.1 glutamine synthetase family protein [Mameliella alba]MBY6170430.1 glutamine synthetase family protein [Mameliella alba]MBY6175448.1 glutamine synthetase family protein [Mameliella alba]
MTAPSADWLHDRPQIRTIRAAACDVNGVARGKRMPIPSAIKMLKDGTRFPFSALNVDIWGEDIADSPLVFDSGDRDAILFPTERGFVPMPWLEAPSALIPIWMFHEDGRPYEGDPRHALSFVQNRFAEKGLTPVVAVELEFYLIDDSRRQLQVPVSPRSGKRRDAAEVLSIRALDAFDTFFTDLYEACEVMDIPADTLISEAGIGQFEVNLMHQPDPLKAADDAWLFKMLVKGLARKHGFAASFMAKPYEDYSGNGMHAHFSVLDKDGKNIFDNGGAEGTDALRHAIGGCLAALADSTLIYAPHLNSFERLVPDAHAPSAICWAYDNRTAAVRVPSGAPVARRIEHRVAGGDVNPYLALAAILGAALTGLEDGIEPPAQITGNAYDQDLPQMPSDWGSAIDAFDNSTIMRRIFPQELIRNFVMTKRQELRDMDELTKHEQMELYLDTV